MESLVPSAAPTPPGKGVVPSAPPSSENEPPGVDGSTLSRSESKGRLGWMSQRKLSPSAESGPESDSGPVGSSDDPTKVEPA